MMGCKWMKKMVCIIFSICFLLSYSLNAYAVTKFTIWNSTGDRIAYWDAERVMVSFKKLNDNDSFYYSSALNTAVSRWNSALSLGVVLGAPSFSNIHTYGGTYNELTSLGYTLDTLATGATVYSCKKVGTYSCTVDGKTKTLYKMTEADVLIVDGNRTAEQYKKTFLHELGHALGWLDHSPVATDVMYMYSSSITTLTSRDIAHLSQVY